MYAIVRTGGKQLKVAAGDVVRIERALGRGPQEGRDARALGRSVIAVWRRRTCARRAARSKGATVQAKVLGEMRARKVLVFKKKRSKQYRGTHGHRQTMIQVRIDAIEG